MATILAILKSLFSALDGILDYANGERLRKLGKLEADRDAQAADVKRNEEIATKIDSRPVPADKHRILDGM